MDLTEKILKKFGFDRFEVMLSTRPAESVGNDDIWEKATNGLIGALGRKGWSYAVDEGGGAFYGPKIDIKIQDAIGRRWQCSTIQCDFNLPERFELEYTASDQTKQRPIMVHRAIFGSIERFFGVLIEVRVGSPFMCLSVCLFDHMSTYLSVSLSILYLPRYPSGCSSRCAALDLPSFTTYTLCCPHLILSPFLSLTQPSPSQSTAGEIPLWLAPVQLRLLPVVDEVLPYCQEIKKQAERMGIRVEIDSTGGRLAKQIRTAQLEKVPVVAVIGVKERDNNELAVRIRGGGDLGSFDRAVILQALVKAAADAIELAEMEGFEVKPPAPRGEGEGEVVDTVIAEEAN